MQADVDRPRLVEGFAAAQSALAIVDHGMRFVLVNTVFEATVGRSSDELLGKRLDDLWLIEVGDRPLLERLREERSVTVDALPASDQGDLQPGSFMFTIQADPPGSAEQIAVVLVPTDSLHRQQQISTGSTGFQLSFDQLDVGMAIFGMDGTITDVNQAMCQLLGRTREEVGTLDAVWVHPEDRQATMEQAIKTLTGEIGAWKMEKRLFHKDGHIVWVLESTTLVRDPDGNPLHFLAQFIDISERKQAEHDLRASEAQVTFLADGLPVAVIEIAADGVVSGGNKPLVELLGADRIGTSVADFVHADDMARIRDSFGGAAGGSGADWKSHFRVWRADGEVRWIRAHTRAHLSPDGRFERAISTWADVTDEFDARSASERFAELLEAVEDVVAITDPTGVVVHVNRAGREQILAGSGEGPRHLADLFPAEARDQITGVALPAVQDAGRWTGEVVINAVGAGDRVVSLSIVAHCDERGAVEYLSAITRDVTELKRAEERMRHQATTDALTGLPNRTILFDRLVHAMAHAQRNAGTIAVLFIDLDRFKPVNDEYGHEAGDAVLVEAAKRLARSVRECDTVARIGGDEFVALCEPSIQTKDALMVANRIVDSMSEPFVMPFGTVHIGASVGLVMGDGSSDPKALVRDADLAAYRAKAAGRSCVVVADQVSADAH